MDKNDINKVVQRILRDTAAEEIGQAVAKAIAERRAQIAAAVNEYLDSHEGQVELKKCMKTDIHGIIQDDGLCAFLSTKELNMLLRKAAKSVLK